MMVSNVDTTAQAHIKVAHSTLRYLRGASISFALLLKPGQEEQLCAYVEAALRNESESKRRSHFGILILFGETPVYDSIQMQIYISLS